MNDKEFKQMLDKLVDQEEKHLQVNSEEFNQMLSSKLNAASSVTLKQVFYSA